MLYHFLIMFLPFWIYENHICELRSEELNEGWWSQLYTQLFQSRKNSLNPIQAWIFFRLSFCNCKSCVNNGDDHPSFNSSLCNSHIWFSYIQNFIIILSQVYNKPIQWPVPSWLVSLNGRALHRYRRGQGFESRTSLNFSQAFFSQLQKLRI